MELVKIASGQDGDTYYAYCTHNGHEYGAAFSHESEADAIRTLAEILGQRLVNINSAMRSPIHRGLDTDTIILTPVEKVNPKANATPRHIPEGDELVAVQKLDGSYRLDSTHVNSPDQPATAGNRGDTTPPNDIAFYEGDDGLFV